MIDYGDKGKGTPFTTALMAIMIDYGDKGKSTPFTTALKVATFPSNAYSQ